MFPRRRGCKPSRRRLGRGLDASAEPRVEAPAARELHRAVEAVVVCERESEVAELQAPRWERGQRGNRAILPPET
jgi:hypothetical protein